MKSQWDCVLQNLGDWQGSFTRLSSQGAVIEDTPSLISIQGVNNNQSIHLTLHRNYPTQPGASDRTPNELVMDFSEPGPGALFFETGAFSEGSLYFRSGIPFGAEFSFLHGDRRLRLIQQFDGDSRLYRLTLVREQRVGTAAPERPPLTWDAWQGNWHGDAITRHLGTSTPEMTTTTVHLDQPTFEQNSQPYQVLCLPDGGASTCPTQITTGQPFFLEVGWLLAPGLRQRLIRAYDHQGKWSSLTWVQEHRIDLTTGKEPHEYSTQ